MWHEIRVEATPIIVSATDLVPKALHDKNIQARITLEHLLRNPEGSDSR